MGKLIVMATFTSELWSYQRVHPSSRTIVYLYSYYLRSHYIWPSPNQPRENPARKLHRGGSFLNPFRPTRKTAAQKYALGDDISYYWWYSHHRGFRDRSKPIIKSYYISKGWRSRKIPAFLVWTGHIHDGAPPLIVCWFMKPMHFPWNLPVDSTAPSAGWG